MRAIQLGACVLALAGAIACGDDPASPTSPSDADLTVLFIGNSLTYSNNLPARVATVAEAAGHSIAVASVTAPGVSLEDHWNDGVADHIRAIGADVVVMQQGPSSLPENQIHLRTWSERLAVPIREAGGEPALYMVWPSVDRLSAFDAVRESYRSAALATGGLFLPAGESWRAAWEEDPELALYGSDGFHPSELGSTVAALTIYAVLYDDDVSDLPAELIPRSSGLPLIRLGPEIAALVYGAVDRTVARFGLQVAMVSGD